MWIQIWRLNLGYESCNFDGVESSGVHVFYWAQGLLRRIPASDGWKLWPNNLASKVSQLERSKSMVLVFCMFWGPKWFLGICFFEPMLSMTDIAYVNAEVGVCSSFVGPVEALLSPCCGHIEVIEAMLRPC